MAAMPYAKITSASMVFFGWCLALNLSAAERGAPPMEKIRISFAAFSASYMDQFAAIEKGYYREEGFDVEVIRAGGGVATPALMAEEIHFSTSSGSALSAMVRGAEIRVVYTNLDRPGYQLWSGKPEIRTVKDLIGKQIGIPSRGDTHEISVRLLLKKHRIDPNSVAFTPVGFGGTRLAAIQAGSIDAATLGGGDVGQLKQPRGHLLADIEKEVKFAYTGVAVSNRLLARNPELVERFLRGAIKGREYARRHKEPTLAFIQKYNKTKREFNEQDYDSTLPVMTPEGWVPEEDLKEDILVRAELVALSNPPEVKRLFDYSLVKKIYAELKAKGWTPAP
jgi:ABC-type nitrate/sulfonate/bicarbonate transport system substrate-binding protein